jgi:hypothetical protein
MRINGLIVLEGENEEELNYLWNKTDTVKWDLSLNPERRRICKQLKSIRRIRR